MKTSISNALCRLIFRQFLVFKIRRLQKSEQRIAEQIRVVPIVESKFKLVKVAVEMFHTELMVRADDRTLEQRPRTFNGVCVNIATNPFLKVVVNGIVDGVRVPDFLVGLQLVGVNRGSGFDAPTTASPSQAPPLIAIQAMRQEPVRR